MVYELLNGTYGQIDFGLCAEAINKTTTEIAQSLGAVLGLLTVCTIILLGVAAILYAENKHLRDYLRRRNALNDYETWKKDRKVE